MTTTRARVVALHGFLGRPSDWDELRPLIPWAQVEAVDLWRWCETGGARDWEAAGRQVDRLLNRLAAGEPTLPTVLVAYSFGARLALAAPGLAGGRTRIAGACIVSCNPGMPDGDVHGRAARRQTDEAWARLLLDAPEDRIWRAWDAQPVLAGPRGESLRESRGPDSLPAERATLAGAMRTFSLAGQPDFRPRLRRWQTPLLWVTGEADVKFSAFARDLARQGVAASFVSCPRAGHRVPWDNPDHFAAALAAWVEQLAINQSDRPTTQSTNLLNPATNQGTDK